MVPPVSIQLDWRVYALRVPARWLVGWSLLGLIFAYGALGYFKSSIGIETIKRMFTGVVTASALLHFYYDGFIWKVREKSTRHSLGIGGGTADVSTKGFLPSWALHGEMGGCFCHSSWSTLVQGGAHPWEPTRTPRHDRR